MKNVLLASGFTIFAATLLVSQLETGERVGPLPQGGFLLNSGAVLRPAGRQIELDTFPMSSALSANKKWLLVLHGGYNPPSIAVLDAATLTMKQRVPVADAWLGMMFVTGGKTLYVSGGSRASVNEFTFDDNKGELRAARTFEINPGKPPLHTDFIGDVAVSPDGRLVYAAALYQDAVLVINPQSGRVIERVKVGRRPYRILFHPDGKSFFVSHWAGASVGHYEAETGKPLGQLQTGPHPTDMIWSGRKPEAEPEGKDAAYAGRLFITNSNINSVTVAGVSDSKLMRVVETLNVSLYPEQPAGMTPSALALSEDERQLYVVCSDANAVAVADIGLARSRVTGFIPTGWYPLAARKMDNDTLLVLNGRGNRSFPNPRGPNPSVRTAPVHRGTEAVQYTPRMQKGSLSVITGLTPESIDMWSAQVRANTPYTDKKLFMAHLDTTSVVPVRPGDKSPIEHVVYIIKENRTYDQVLGDLGKGNGDPKLTLFPEKISPNHHKLAREFVLLDNFYVSADVSADGHNWSTAAIAPDYVQKMWPNSYGGRRKHYDYEGGEPAALPPAGYIWNNALARGLTLRNYGYFVTNKPLAEVGSGDQVGEVRDQALRPHTHMGFRGFDLNYPDIDRARVFLADLDRMNGENKFPQFVLLRIGNDHTSGAAADKPSPLSQMADNDYALGMIIEGLSRSKFWEKMAIFVLEDDAQNGPDHVDSHRSPAYVISPYSKRDVIDSSFYNTTSMLRTMELILGIRPMTMFDAGARPMIGTFQNTPNLTAYTAEKPRHPLNERNPKEGALAARTARMEFGEADEIDDDEMNEILWLAIKKTEPPPPVRSYFGR